MTQKIYFVVNANMPSEKAHGIHIAKMCEAFIESGINLTLVVPSRGSGESLREFYGLRVEVPVVRLPSIKLRRYGGFGFRLMALSFMLSHFVFLWARYLSGERFVLYTVDLDRYSSSALALVPAPLFSEMHGSKPRTLLMRLLFARVRGVIATNAITAKELQHTFAGARAPYLVEPNGVDPTMFVPQDKEPARRALGLPQEVPIVLYSGRFFAWKGLEILAAAAAETPDTYWQIVGGTREEFQSLVPGELPSNMHFAGGRAHGETPQWMSAADAVVVLGTKRDEQSYKWTSPMKLFEYLRMGRPIVAADTPALREIISDREAFIYRPDDASDLAGQVVRAISPQGAARASAAQKLGERYSWSARAQRIKLFIQNTLHGH